MNNKPEILFDRYYKACYKQSDMFEHMPNLKMYADECESVTEMGVRGIVSTYAFLMSKCKKLTSIDIVNPSVHGGNIQEIYDIASSAGIDFKFIQSDTLKIEIEPTDLLFIDTLHAYDQLKKELALHSHKAKKFIILHDTVTFGQYGHTVEEPGMLFPNIKGLSYAIQEFMEAHRNEWAYDRIYYNCNGLTVLKRINNEI
jgi:hypothetical protein